MTALARDPRRLLIAGAFALTACVAPREGVHSASPAEAVVASGMAAREIVRDKGSEVVLGWKLEIVGDRAHFFACTAEDSCGDRRVDVPASRLLAVKVVGRARPFRNDGASAAETDVLRITITHGVKTSRGGVTTDPQRGMTLGGSGNAN